MQVAHRRVDVGVAHPLLELEDRDLGLADHLRAERVTQVVEAQIAQPGSDEAQACSGDEGLTRQGTR